MSGWLNKQGGTLFKNWKRRFFVVNSQKMEIYYYIDAADHSSKKEPQGKFSLVNYIVSSDTIKETSFKLSCNGCRTYYMQAETAKEQQEWMSKLHQLLQSSQAATQKSSIFDAARDGDVALVQERLAADASCVNKPDSE